MILLSCNSTYRLRYWNDTRYRKARNTYMCCNSTYRLRYWNFPRIKIQDGDTLSVATVLTVYGIETEVHQDPPYSYGGLQQYLPFTVLKQEYRTAYWAWKEGCNSTYRLRYWNVMSCVILFSSYN